MNRTGFFAGLSQQISTPLSTTFYHDSRLDVFTYSEGWGYFPNAGGSYYNEDTVAVPGGSPIDLSFEFSFTSEGGLDELVTMYGVPGDGWTLYLNNEPLIIRTLDSPQTYIISELVTYESFGSFRGNPYLNFRPVSGLNKVRFFRLAHTSGEGTYIDGTVLTIHGSVLLK